MVQRDKKSVEHKRVIRRIDEFLNRLSIQTDCHPNPKFKDWTPGQVVRYIRAAIVDDVMEER